MQIIGVHGTTISSTSVTVSEIVLAAAVDVDNFRAYTSPWFPCVPLASSDCPNRGCYDCPNFRNPGDNPYFKAKQKKANEARVKDMMANGDADMYRKTAEL
jgi:hypothetical protein